MLCCVVLCWSQIEFLMYYNRCLDMEVRKFKRSFRSSRMPTNAAATSSRISKSRRLPRGKRRLCLRRSTPRIIITIISLKLPSDSCRLLIGCLDRCLPATPIAGIWMGQTMPTRGDKEDNSCSRTRRKRSLGSCMSCMRSCNTFGTRKAVGLPRNASSTRVSMALCYNKSASG